MFIVHKGERKNAKTKGTRCPLEENLINKGAKSQKKGRSRRGERLKAKREGKKLKSLSEKLAMVIVQSSNSWKKQYQEKKCSSS